MSKPVLHVFAISHYCEKARWALDYLDIDYKLRYLAPGIHIQVAKKLGLPATSLPILTAGGTVLQGSREIVDWADAKTASVSKRLTPDAARDECLALEKRLDDVTGIHIRRYYYSEALVDHPESVRPIFTRDLSILHRFIVGRKWQMIRGLMIERMDLGRDQGQASKRILEGELDWLDGLLFDGRRFLAGDRLSRADITAAALLAPLARPRQHPTYANLSLPPNLAADLANWQGRPIVNWIGEIYRQYR